MPINYLELMDGLKFPATKVEIVAHAEDQDASEEALETIRSLPKPEYNNIHSISNDLGLVEEQPGGATNIFGSR